MAVDLVSKRQNLASQAVDASTKFTDALYLLQLLMDERAKLQEPFVDSDFAGVPGLKHLDAATLGVLFDFVMPSFLNCYEDTTNGGRNKQILMQVRR